MFDAICLERLVRAFAGAYVLRAAAGFCVSFELLLLARSLAAHLGDPYVVTSPASADVVGMISSVGVTTQHSPSALVFKGLLCMSDQIPLQTL